MQLSKGEAISEGALFLDFYQLTMAQLYFEKGLYNKQAQFEYFFRKYPNYNDHQSGYCVFAGLQWLLARLEKAKFNAQDIECLSSQTDKNGKPVFKKSFLNWLKDKADFSTLSIKAVPEGRVVHPNVPLVVVRGPLAVAQIIETAVLNHLNYQTLIATKASRISQAGQGKMMIDFGMRRAQGKGANEGSRAALIGGADFSSNTGLSCSLGLPPKGTHAHSMVQAFLALGHTELDAFRAYADIYPDNCILLVDTINTLNSGVPNAIKVFQELKKKGHKPLGIRLDSGDLAYLSIKAAKMLNDAGFKKVKIVLSNQLDELVIWQILSQIRRESRREGVNANNLINRLVYGVGTRLITSQGCPALDGIYKLTALKQGRNWQPALKLSESSSKIINPGVKKVSRIYDCRRKAIADLISLAREDLTKKETFILRHPAEHAMYRKLHKSDISKIEPLLVEVYREGVNLCGASNIGQLRKIKENDLDKLDSGVKRLINPHIYHVSLTQKLWDLKQSLIDKHKKER